MQEYTVTTPDGTTYTAQLDAEDAKRLDAKPVSTKSGTASNKSRTSANKSKS